MKTKLIIISIFTGIALLPMSLHAALPNTNSAIFIDANGRGCLAVPNPPGGPGLGPIGAGGNQAHCSTCGGSGSGMPVWWVDEPYINLHISDEPLSYFTSSGQEMSFRFFYKQRFNLPEVGGCFNCGGPFNYYLFDSYSVMRAQQMTNASWSHNWMMDLEFWDEQWDSSALNSPTRRNPVYSDGYEMMVFYADGGVDYLYNDVTGQLTNNPISQASLQPLSGLRYPTAGATPVADANGIYWGAPTAGASNVVTTNGFRLVYPDGSQDVFSLAFYIEGIPNPAEGFPQTAARALLTQRIDPQGRATLIGYEHFAFTNYWNVRAIPYFGYRVKYVVDSDGRTNTFIYNTNTTIAGTNSSLVAPFTGWQLQEIDDPFGRKAQFIYDATILRQNGRLIGITDAATNTSLFSYQTWTFLTTTNIWLSGMTTPYGTTSFSFYENPDTTETNAFLERAAYASEPEGAQQLYYYVHSNSQGVPASATSPAVPNRTFDNGTNGNSGASALTFRNSFHWDRRQSAAFPIANGVPFWLSRTSFDTPANQAKDVKNALLDLTAPDFMRAHMTHWMLAADGISLSDLKSSERDPSPDAAGLIEGARTWYSYPTQFPDMDDASPVPEHDQIYAIAQLLPDGSSQYTRYNFGFAPSIVAQNESSYSLPNGSVAERTNYFTYTGRNAADLQDFTDSANQITQFSYNGNHQVTSIIDALNQTNLLTYDGTTHNLTSIIFSTGQTNTLTYYSAGTNATSSMLQQIEIEPQGAFINITAYTNGLPEIVHVSGTGLVDLWLTNTWDGLNRLTGTTFQDGTTTSNVYTFLDRTAHKDRLDHWTYFGFDSLEHLTAITNALMNVTSLSWCGCGALSSITDATLTNTINFNYDNQGRLTNILYPDSSSLTYQFDLNGRLINTSDGSGRSMQYTYNNQGLVTAVNNSNGPLAQVVYDILDRPQTVTDANGITVNNSFDALNRILARTWPDNNSELFQYATNGLITFTNRDQKVTHFVRDNAGRLAAVTNANQEVTHFGYDAAGRILSLGDGLNHTNQWQYNQFGWLTNKIDGLNRKVLTNGYDANGRLTDRFLPASGDTIYSYDAVGNLTNVDYSTGTIPTTPTVQLTYDVLNRLSTMVDGVGTTTFGYTRTGQLQSETGPWTSNTVSYAYNQGQRTNLTLVQPGVAAWVQSYVYDSTWRLQSLTSPAGGFGYGYGQFNAVSALVSSIALPNGAAIANHYDSLARLDNTALLTSWGHVLDGYGYSYGRLDLRTGITRNFGLTTNSVTAGYDNIGQLTSWTAEESGGAARLNEQLTFGYDAADNLHLRTNGALVQTFTVDAANELTGVSRTGTLTVTGATPVPASVTVNGAAAQTNGDFTFASTNNSLVSGLNPFVIVASNAVIQVTNNLNVNLPGSISLGEDTSGNLTGDGTRVFVYDAENQLTNVYVTNLWKTEFGYDGFGRRRIERDYTWRGVWVRTNETHFIYDGMMVIQERDSNNVPQVTYTRGLDLSDSLQGAGGIGGLLSRTDTNGSTFYHADGGGNVTALMDGKQNIVARYLYDPFGRQLGQWGTLAAANKYRFSSKEIHANSGMYYYGFRFYEPNLQRWLNQDPIGEAGGMNLYGFVGNSSPNMVDPHGLEVGFTYDATGMHNYLNDPANAARFNASLNATGHAIGKVLDGIDWTLEKIDDGLNSMRDSGNPFTRGIGTGLWAGSWLFGGPELKIAKEAKAEGLFAKLLKTCQDFFKGKPEKKITTPVGELRATGLNDAHHVIQDAAVRDLPGYNTLSAPGVQLDGPSTAIGTPHYLATQIQRAAGGGTYAEEREIAANALRAAGYSEAQIQQALTEADNYFKSIGVGSLTPTRIPGNRKP